MRRTSVMLGLPLLLMVAGLALGLAPGRSGAEPPPATTSAAVRVEAVPVYLDPRGRPLAAYQFELSAADADLAILGVESGQHPAFAEPPAYDQRAILRGGADRVVVAGFSLRPADELPTGRTRLATVMVQITPTPGADPRAAPRYDLDLIAAGDPAGNRLEATLDHGDAPRSSSSEPSG